MSEVPNLLRSRYVESSPVLIEEVLALLAAALRQFSDLEEWAIFCSVHQRATASAGRADVAKNGLLTGEEITGCGGTNIASISSALGLPRETVRRKVQLLIGRGWVRRGEDQLLFVGSAAVEELAALREQLYASVARVTQLVDRLRASEAAQDEGLAARAGAARRRS